MHTMKHDPKRESGIEDDPLYPRDGDEYPKYEKWVNPPCVHPEHKPPSHMVIPEGKIYRHICPGCGYEIVIRPPTIIHW